MGQMTQPTV